MKSDQYTSIGEARGSFQTTHWTAIEKIRSDDDISSKALIGDLLKNYWKPVYCYLRHKDYDNEQAKDLTQSFFYEVVLGRELIKRADRTKGRFRNLLLTALDRYLVSMHRKETACKRIPQDKLFSLEDAGFRELPAVVDSMNSDEVFQYTWVCEMLDRILEKVEIECSPDCNVYKTAITCRALSKIRHSRNDQSLRYDIYGQETDSSSNKMLAQQICGFRTRN